MGFGQKQQVIQKYHAIRTNAAILGIPIPILIGQNRLTAKLIWYNDFTANKAKQQGGKGLGKGGSQYVYTASIMAALCHGPLSALLSVWDNTGRFVVQGVTESYTVGSPYTYTPTYAAAFASDQGVAAVTAYSYSGINDYGSPGAITLAGNTPVGMTPTTGTPSAGQYKVNPATGVYTFASADAGKNVQISYGFYRYILATEELSIVPFSGPYTVTVQNSATFNTDLGVKYYPGGNAFTKVSSGPTVGQYSQSGGTYTFAAADTGQGIVINYQYADPNTDNNAPSSINLTLIGGGQGQSPWSYLTSKHPSQALGYTQLAMIASSQLYLGYSPELPNYNYEVAGAYQVGGGILDANPADCITAILSDPGYGIGFPLASIGDLTLARKCWTANSFFISPVLENQQSTASVIGEWLEAGMVGAYWSEGLLKFVPYCDTSAVGHGVLYQPSTTPVASLTDSNFLVDDKAEDPVKVTRTPYMDAYNRVSVSYSARVNDYNPEVVYEQDDASIQRYGLRSEDSQSWDFITTLLAAQYAASMRLQRNVYIRNTYEFRLPSSFAFLEPMDVVTITDSVLGLNGAPVRIQKIEDDPEKGLSIVAEDFIWGAAAPAYNPKDTNNPPAPLPGQEDPGNTQAVIFEAPGRLGLQQGNMLYGFVNGSNENWGGCHVWVSFDGTNYQLQDTVNFPARMGTLVAGLAAYGGANPDTTHTLAVAMTDDTPLSSTTSGGAAANVTLCAIVSAGPTLELLSYQTATLVADQQYNLTTLYRGIYGTLAGAHLTGDLFCRLDEASFQFQYDPTYVGKNIWYKFTSFNLLGQNEQNLANVTAYEFALQGTTGAIEMDTGYLGIVAPGYAAYRPLSNPLMGHDAGSNATINVAAFSMALAGHVNISYNSGSITALAYNTLYYVYFDDSGVPAFGGSVSYTATTTKEDTYGTTRFFVGSIQTPRAGAPDTTGNNDGGNGSQGGMLNIITPSSTAATVSNGNHTITNPNFALDGDMTSFANLSITTSGSGGDAIAFRCSAPPSILRHYSSVTVKVRMRCLTNNLTGGSQIVLLQVFENKSGGFYSEPLNLGPGATQSLTTFSVSVPTNISLSNVIVEVDVQDSGANSTPGQVVTVDIAEIWIEAIE
jgi:hypothetical protein